MRLAKLKRVFAVAMLSSIAFAVYADDAPVYEADNYPPPFDGQQVDAPSSGMADSGGLTPEVNQSATITRQDAYVPQAAPVPPPRPLTMDQRVRRVEQQVKICNKTGGSLSRAEELQKEVQMLRAQVEEMSHQLQQAQAQQKAMYEDLDKRLASLHSVNSTAMIKESVTSSIGSKSAKTDVTKNAVAAKSKGSTLAETPKKATGASQPNPAEEQQIYQTAYDLIKAKKYNDAVTTLQRMLQKYPTGQTAANAHFWLGELYGLLNKSEQSANEFSVVIKKYPGSPKVPDAQLKLGLIYIGQFKWTEAKTTFKSVVSQHPGTASARLASEQLKQIKKAGH